MKGIMIQGTSSDSGKSFITTALCRIFANEGKDVFPFKSQNMSNNSYVTVFGEEIGRAQAVQAEAAKKNPNVYMNPILLKPKKDNKSEIILFGKVFNDYDSQALYRDFTMNEGKKAVEQSLSYIKKNHDIILIEGAGSPAEINLSDREIVNMYVAREADVDVFLVADIDRGGVFAQIVGTLELLFEDRKRVKGIIINKFRGDIKLFEDGIKWIEEYTKVKVSGVIPYIKDIHIESEDSLSIKDLKYDKNKINIGVIQLSRVSNITDVEAFIYEDDINIVMVNKYNDLNKYDAIIIPGTKSTIDDLKELKESMFENRLKEFLDKDGFLVGICGGYQMLSKSIKDPYNVDSLTREIKGFGVIDAKTTFEKNKNVKNVRGYLASDKKIIVKGYEIHLGKTEVCYSENISPLFIIEERFEGMISSNQKIIGTYLHNVFHNDEFRNNWLNKIRIYKGLEPKSVKLTSEMKEENYEKLAKIVKDNLDMEYINSILGE